MIICLVTKVPSKRKKERMDIDSFIREIELMDRSCKITREGNSVNS
jgi:hypothetical protein